MNSEAERRLLTHYATLRALLDKPAGKHQTSRIYRARWYHHDSWIVATIMQRLVFPESAPPGYRHLDIMVMRGYDADPPYVRLPLAGRVSIDEVLAFLRLSEIEPDAVDWRDETVPG